MHKRGLVQKIVALGLVVALGMTEANVFASTAAAEVVTASTAEDGVLQADVEAEVQTVVSPEITGAFADATQTAYQFTVTNCTLEAGDSLKAGVWSSTNGQDDLKWIKLSSKGTNTYGGTVNISDFKSAGKYVMHIYNDKVDGTMKYVAGQCFNVSGMTNGKVEIKDDIYNDGKATVKISNVSSPSGIKKVKMAVWSTSNQSDLHWYTAHNQNGTWSIEVDIAKYHKNNWGTYTVHVYAEDGNGFEQYVGGTTKLNFTLKTAKPKVIVNESTKKLTIEINNSEIAVPNEINSIQCAVWSTANGQDDLQWHTLTYNKTTDKWVKEVSLTTLKSTGACLAHVYVVKTDGGKIYLGGAEFKISNTSISSCKVKSDNASGQFSVSIGKINAPLGCTKIKAAVWSTANQSDLVWYEAKVQNDGTYLVSPNISKHNYNIGTYNIHVYVTNDLGMDTCVLCTTAKIEKSLGNLTAEETKADTLFKMTLEDVVYPGGLKEVTFGVWSNHNGQDDLKWYTASVSGNSYVAELDVKNHKTTGTYSVHVYGIAQNGQKVFLAGHGALVNIKGTSSGKIRTSDVNANKGTVKVTLSDMKSSSGIDTVKLAVWTMGDQSDLHWYTCTKQNESTWSTTVDAANHKYHSGVYQMHAYTVMGNQIESYTVGTSLYMKLATKVYVNNDLGKGKRTLIITNPANTSNLRFGVWSETNGQNDLVWYTASQSTGGTWTAVLNGKDFKDYGTFQVHVYAGSSCIGITTFEMSKQEVVKNGWYYEVCNGKTYKLYYVNDVLQTDVSGILGPQSSYIAEVNRIRCTVTIYAKDGANGYIIPVKVFACSVGLPETPTPTGKFYTLAKYRWAELMGPSYGQYCTRIVGGILFHSVAGSNMTSYNLSAGAYNMLGQPASHGCVRLTVRDAKWIYDNCKIGMEVNIFDSSYAGPLGKPATIKIPASQNWDPTDPAV